MEKSNHSTDTEDLPSDFFDDFNKDEFIRALSVVDSWEDTEEDHQRRGHSNGYHHKEQFESEHQEEMDNYIKPGSRRDIRKTNEAIKRDKEDKVKAHIAKHLESDGEVRPPGTELDDYFTETRVSSSKRKSQQLDEDKTKSIYPSDNVDLSDYGDKNDKYDRVSKRTKYQKHYEDIIKRSPTHSYQLKRSYKHEDPRESGHIDSRRNHESPIFFRKQHPYASGRYLHRSPIRFSPRRSQRSPHRRRRSKRRSLSPKRDGKNRRSRSRSFRRETYKDLDPRSSRYRSPTRKPPSPLDLYKIMSEAKQAIYSSEMSTSTPSQFNPVLNENNNASVGYGYSAPVYSENPAFSGAYDYGAQVVQPVPYVAQAVPMPVPAPIPASNLVSTPMPSTVTNPVTINAFSSQVTNNQNDPLAQLVVEGKISHEDYLKLTPNKGQVNQMDTEVRVKVLNRCHQALAKLSKLLLPNRLMMNNNIIATEPKLIAPKYCSPLKRQTNVEFYFTKSSDMCKKQNQQLIDSIISTVGIDKEIVKMKKKGSRNKVDAAVQTTKPFCEVCEIRDSIKRCGVCTSVDKEHFYSTVHTQVIEKDLLNSKFMFNPSGGVASGAAMSIAHMTPAQLVSQLAARAKSLQQSEESTQQNYTRPGGYGNYDYRY